MSRPNPVSAARRAQTRRRIWGDEAVAEPALQGINDSAVKPARHRRDVRAALLIGLPLAFLMVVAGLLAGSMTDWRFGLASPPADAPPPPPPDPLAALPEQLKARLTAPAPEVPAILKLSFSGSPHDLCVELAILGLPNKGWHPDPYHVGHWQCSSELVEIGPSTVDGGPTTMFFLLRGRDEATADHLRLKLNGANIDTFGTGRKMMVDVLQALSRRYAWAIPGRFLDAIATPQRLEMTDRGVRLSVAPEDPNLTGDPSANRRINVIVDFGEPDLIRPARGFEHNDGRKPARR
ncbi:hypothetical protein SL003B_2880 [Polymorphum gilvum SL003B-26A1]|uniref:Uncharacterized protein n=2 Tax=Polymorphum TaxID=991903 RepID=F2J6C9_POLGS|nr:hypothetical protein SL003B_2880 [Polymorphum gilvum SL003B-26A1]